MKIQKSELAEWERLRCHGDISIIAKRFGLNRTSLHEFIGKDEVSEEVYTAFKTFYNERKLRIQNLQITA